MQVVSRLLEAPYLTVAGIWDLASLLRQYALREEEQRLRQQAAAHEDATEAATGTGGAVVGMQACCLAYCCRLAVCLSWQILMCRCGWRRAAQMALAAVLSADLLLRVSLLITT